MAAADLVAVTQKCFAKKLRTYFESHAIFDGSRRLSALGTDKIAIPVKAIEEHIAECNYAKCSIKNQCYYCINDMQFYLTHHQLAVSYKTRLQNPYQRLQEACRSLCQARSVAWTELLANDVPHGWEKHGNLVMFSSDAFVLPQWSQLGPDLWQSICLVLGVKRLARKAAIRNDTFRTPQVELLHGDNGWVEHIDNRVRYTYDVTKNMFSKGNITEKLRVASFNCQNETVVDLYAGIGYFTLPYLVHAGARRVLACEWNPDAVAALRRNLELNGVADRCTVYEGDNRETCPRDVADRVNLGLIPSSEGGWRAACGALRVRRGGVLHIHATVDSEPIRTPPPSADPRVSLETIADPSVAMETIVDPHVAMETIADRSPCLPHVLGGEGIPATNQAESDVGKDRLLQFPDDGDGVRGGRKTRGEAAKHAWCRWSENAARRIRDILGDLHQGAWRTRVRHVEHVKSYGPNVDHVVVDIDCRPVSSDSPSPSNDSLSPSNNTGSVNK